MAWESLKKALKSRALHLESPLAELQAVSAATLAPEPTPAGREGGADRQPDVLLPALRARRGLRRAVQVKVDFDDSFPRTPDNVLRYAGFVAAACREEGLRPFAADGVARLVEHGSRLVEHQQRLSARLGLLLDLVRESAYCAERDGHTLVTAADVSRAVTQKIERR